MALLDDLKRAVAGKRAVIVAGAGSTIAAVGPGVKHATWTGLIRHGLSHARERGWIKPNACDHHINALALDDLPSLIGAAEIVASVLEQSKGNGRFSAWLREAVGDLKVVNDAVPKAIDRLRTHGLLVTTTNYDSILADIGKVPPVLATDVANATRLVGGQDVGILHLHGHWKAPGSIVLGVRTYDATVRHPYQEVLQKALPLRGSFVFVGCGETLNDPNFSHLISWIEGPMLGAEHDHFLLCRESELDTLRGKGWKRIVPLAFGAGHDDLSEFLADLLPSGAAPVGSGTSAGPATPPPPTLTPVPQPPDHFVGRAAEVEQAVTALLAGHPVCVLGPGGIGKTGLTQKVAADARIKAAFARRVFVRLEAAQTGTDAAMKIATALGLEAGPEPLSRAVADLSTRPTLLVLDNAETPWDADPDGTRHMLAECGAVARVLLSIRGRQSPQGLDWTRLELKPLAADPARVLFLGLAGGQLEADPLLPDMLRVADGVPLALRLLAAQSEGLPDLRDVWTQWQAEKAALLRQGKADSKETNFAASVGLSLNSPRMTAEGKRLLGLLGLLPDGLARPMRDDLLGSVPAARGASTLLHLALALEEKDRLRLLVPVREVVAATLPPEPEDRFALERTMIELALEGKQLGRSGGQEAVARITPEFENIGAVLNDVLTSERGRTAIGPMVSLASFQRFTGIGTPTLLVRAADQAAEFGDTLGQANCILYLGDIALYRSDHDTARARFEEAIPIFRRIGSELGEANCIRSLGAIALRRSDHHTARARYEEALPLYRRVGNVLGAANCIRSLGDIALGRSDPDTARARYEEALPLYRRIGDVMGEANCIKGLGDIAHRRSDHDMARTRFEEALSLYRRVGTVLGEANCIQSLGDIALERSDHDTARARYEEALPLYRRVGDVLGEANCIKGLGDIAYRRSDHDAARARFEEALPLYRRIGNVLGEANCIRCLGEVALRHSDHEGARARFNEAIPLYRKVGDLEGEAETLQGLGELARAVGDRVDSRDRYSEALALFRRIPSPHLIGLALSRLAAVADRESERQAHRAAAREAWRTLGDWGERLIAEYLSDENPPEET